MRSSVTLPDEDVRYLDAYAHAQGLRSRSAALHEAVRLLRAAELGAGYDQAWAAWHESGEATQWERTAGGGPAH